MKRIFCLLGLSLMVTVLPARADTIALNLTSPVQVGSSFDVAVQVADVFSGRAPDDFLVAYGFNVAIGDGSIVRYTGETQGSLFDDLSGLFGGPAVAGFATNPAGIGPLDFSGLLSLATLHFDLLMPGATTIGVIWDSSDLNQGLIYAFLPYGPISASTTVKSVPEPGTLALLLSALAIFLISMRSGLRWINPWKNGVASDGGPA